MDHHCHFINNCVGRRNHKPFYLYLVFLDLAVLYVLVLTYPSWIWLREECGGYKHVTEPSSVYPSHRYGIGFLLAIDYFQLGCDSPEDQQSLLVLAGLFCVSVFTLAGVSRLLWFQTISLCNGITYIEQLQQYNTSTRHTHPARKQRFDHLLEMLCPGFRQEPHARLLRLLLPDWRAWRSIMNENLRDVKYT